MAAVASGGQPALGEEQAVRRRPKTKIVYTLNQASRSVKMISRLLRTGMCIARFNFSHGSHEYHQETPDNLHTTMERTGILCAVMLDTKVRPRLQPYPLPSRPSRPRAPFRDL
jgi:pyruvate kinase